MLSAILRVAQTDNHPFYDGFDVQKVASLVFNNRSVQLLFREEKLSKEAFLKRIVYDAFSEDRNVAMLEQISRRHFEEFLTNVESGIVMPPSSRIVITVADVLMFCTGMRKFANSEEESKVRVSFQMSPPGSTTRPVARTCTRELNLPLTVSHEEMKAVDS
jgi:hypothetical protein